MNWNLVNGLYRPIPNGEIIPSQCALDTGELGDIKFESPLEVRPDLAETRPPVPVGELYNDLLSHDEAVGAFVCNNLYVVTIFRNGFIVRDWTVPLGEPYSGKVTCPQYACYEVGFVKTIIPVFDVRVLPYKLFYIPEYKSVLINGRLVSMNQEPDPNGDISLYVDLINTGHNCIYTVNKEKRYL